MNSRVLLPKRVEKKKKKKNEMWRCKRKHSFNPIQTGTKCAFDSKLKSQFILLFNLFLLLFIGPIVLFGTIYESHCTISANFYLYLQYF